MRRVSAIVLALILCSACAPFLAIKPAALPEGAREHRRLTYFAGRGFDRFRHRVNVYVPAGKGPHPVIMFAHGGGWRSGDPNGSFGVYRRLGRRLAARGIVAVIAGYRLAPEHRHPLQVHDVAQAIAWTLDHAESFGGDPSRVYAMGHSAGAQLVALAACDPRWLKGEARRLAGVIGISGPYDVADLERVSPAMVRGAFGEKPEIWREASPASHLSSAALPKFMIAVADDDPEILIKQGREFAAALRGSGVRVVEKTIGDRTHFTIVIELGDDQDALAEAIEEFVSRSTESDRR